MGNKKIEKNILIVGLVDEFLDKISSTLAFNLNKYYLNIDELINYYISEKQKMLELCGVEYFEEQERKVITSLKDYENTLMFAKFSTFSSYIDTFKENCIIIYVQINMKSIKKNKKDKFATENLNFLVFQERETFLKNNCNNVIKCDINNLDESLKLLEDYLTQG